MGRLLPVMAAIILIPKGQNFIYAGMAATLAFALVVFSMRGVLWAPMSEVGIPQHITGSAFGVGCPLMRCDGPEAEAECAPLERASAWRGKNAGA